MRSKWATRQILSTPACVASRSKSESWLSEEGGFTQKKVRRSRRERVCKLGSGCDVGVQALMPPHVKAVVCAATKVPELPPPSAILLSLWKISLGDFGVFLHCAAGSERLIRNTLYKVSTNYSSCLASWGEREGRPTKGEQNLPQRRLLEPRAQIPGAPLPPPLRQDGQGKLPGSRFSRRAGMKAGPTSE
jgi:hypothetical protein